ncbi:hypothetical protein Francci3_3997 [Frankia casuarinae]|uniref:Uncharacterized protein n=1 Tax=Frankia casuarinae (strain DSM 45818 / CECT 9043 / HFP020203 / CcI3) TaxID=106370 RepID=Q2J5U5_FRACC|nr:lanthionine synthetase LanC family protein [Frankia casuarinae]ABD13347.1 hypothetical protein Francci3_3997 [Frankia casuarinae]
MPGLPRGEDRADQVPRLIGQVTGVRLAFCHVFQQNAPAGERKTINSAPQRSTQAETRRKRAERPLSDGIKVDGQTEAITRICWWLDAWEQQKPGGGSWWPQIVTLTDLDRGTTSQLGPLRPSWCYGTPGIARSQQLAARALHEPARQRRAETAFLDCLNDPTQLSRLTDRSLCHGTGGLLATARNIAADALTPISLTQPQLLHQPAAAEDDEPPGFLVGSAGADLATTATTTTSWDACLLLR